MKMSNVDRRCCWNWQQQQHYCFCEISVYCGAVVWRGSATCVWVDINVNGVREIVE